MTVRWLAPSLRTRSASATNPSKAALAAINGDEVPETIDTGFYWCDETNFENEETQAVL